MAKIKQFLIKNSKFWDPSMDVFNVRIEKMVDPSWHSKLNFLKQNIILAAPLFTTYAVIEILERKFFKKNIFIEDDSFFLIYLGGKKGVYKASLVGIFIKINKYVCLLSILHFQLFWKRKLYDNMKHFVLD